MLTSPNKDFALSGSKYHYNPNRVGVVQHVFLDIALDITNKVCGGFAHIDLKILRDDITHIVVDAMRMTVSDVRINDKQVEYQYDGTKIEIQLEKSFAIDEVIRITIEYQTVNPPAGITFVLPTKEHPDRPVQVWTQGESQDSRYWFPCFDAPTHISTTEVRIKVPAAYKAVSNGVLVEEMICENTDYQNNAVIIELEGKEDYKVFHYKQNQPIPTYLMALAVSDFAEIKDDYNGLPLSYFGPKGKETDIKRSTGKTPQMIAFYEKMFGVKYPYSVYNQVWAIDFIWGGMENATTTFLAEKGLPDEKAHLDFNWDEMVVAHELTHQWFGDLVVVNHWSHAWVKEGAATYSEALWTEHEYGKDEFDYYRLEEIREYLAEDSEDYRRPIVTNIYRDNTDLYDRHTYSKAGCIYHMFHNELGDKLFTKSLAYFLETHKFHNVDSFDLLKSFEKTTGKNLAPIFDQYVFRGGHPDFVVKYSWDSEHKLAKLEVSQTQAKDGAIETVFDLDIPLSFGYLKNDDKVKLAKINIHISQKDQVFYIPLVKKPDFVLFDDGNHTLKTVKLEYALPELKMQLLHAPDIMARIFAAQALAKLGSLEALNALKNSLKDQEFWGTRLEIYKNIAAISLDQSQDILLAGLNDLHPKVRRQVASLLAKYKNETVWKAILAKAKEKDQSYFVEVASLQTLGAISGSSFVSEKYTKEAVTFLLNTLEKSTSWNEVIRGGTLMALSYIKDQPEIIKVIQGYTSKKYITSLRRGAISALGSLFNYQDEQYQQYILDTFAQLAQETDLFIQMSLVFALEGAKNPRAVGILATIKNNAFDTRLKRDAEVSLSRLQTNLDPAQSFKQIREEIEEIKKENQTLKSRLEQFEEEQKAASKSKKPEEEKNKED